MRTVVTRTRVTASPQLPWAEWLQRFHVACRRLHAGTCEQILKGEPCLCGYNREDREGRGYVLWGKRATPAQAAHREERGCEVFSRRGQEKKSADPGPKVKMWTGDPPTACDLCAKPLTATFVDGKTRQGPWANMCLRCHAIHGVGLGTGRGQRYVKNGDQFVKEEG